MVPYTSIWSDIVVTLITHFLLHGTSVSGEHDERRVASGRGYFWSRTRRWAPGPGYRYKAIVLFVFLIILKSALTTPIEPVKWNPVIACGF